MGCEVDLSPVTIFNGAWIRSVQYFWWCGMIYIGRLNMLNIAKMGM